MNKRTVLAAIAFITCIQAPLYSAEKAKASRTEKVQSLAFSQMGHHLIAEFVSCNPKKLNAHTELADLLRKAALAANATVLNVFTHKFEPQGMTGVAILAESHLAIHTWPELGYASVDIYTCGDHTNTEKALEVLKEFFAPKSVELSKLPRGYTPPAA